MRLNIEGQEKFHDDIQIFTIKEFQSIAGTIADDAVADIKALTTYEVILKFYGEDKVTIWEAKDKEMIELVKGMEFELAADRGFWKRSYPIERFKEAWVHTLQYFNPKESRDSVISPS